MTVPAVSDTHSDKHTLAYATSWFCRKENRSSYCVDIDQHRNAASQAAESHFCRLETSLKPFSVRVRVRAAQLHTHSHTRPTQIHTSHRLLSDLFSAQLVLNEVIMTH